MCYLITSLGGCRSCDRSGVATGDPPGMPPHCVAQNGFPSLAVANAKSAPPAVGGDCHPDECGLNGVWLGHGVRFRTLHMTHGVKNPEKLTVEQFRKAGQNLRLDVQGHDLIGWQTVTKTIFGVNFELDVPMTGADLQNAELMLADFSQATVRNYTLKIEQVESDPFWTRCTSGDCPAQDHEVPIYNFTVTNNSDQCPVVLCSPELEPGPGTNTSTPGIPSMIGRAVIFRGDFYDDDPLKRGPGDYEVRGPVAGEDDLFNIACVGSVISKLHFLRHTSAAVASFEGMTSAQTKAMTTSIPQRQAMMRLLTADYCGIGHPFTRNGVRIDLKLNSAYQPTFLSGGTSSLEALWTDKGASCVSTPRLAKSNEINSTCTGHGRPAPPSCPGISPGSEFVNGDFAMSMNPP
jgi:hypothetical protein